MANEQNLRVPTSSEARINGKKGGIASGEARRAGTEAVVAKAFQAALKGDWKAGELVRDTAGHKPVERVMVADVEASVIAEVEAMVNGSETSG